MRSASRPCRESASGRPSGIIVELREKVAGEIEADADAASLAPGEEDPRSLAREGLLNLGYTPPEAEASLAGPGESPEEIVQSALRSAAGAKPRERPSRERGSAPRGSTTTRPRS